MTSPPPAETSRILGIDYGTRRIGLAISDPDRTMAHPLMTVDVRGDETHLRRIADVARTYNVSLVVIGLPYNMDGSLGRRGQDVLRWGKELENHTGLPVVFWDERLSTCEAHDLMVRHDVKASRRKRVIDRIAAGIILQSYLDAGRS